MHQNIIQFAVEFAGVNSVDVITRGDEVSGKWNNDIVANFSESTFFKHISQNFLQWQRKQMNVFQEYQTFIVGFGQDTFPTLFYRRTETSGYA